MEPVASWYKSVFLKRPVAGCLHIFMRGRVGLLETQSHLIPTHQDQTRDMEQQQNASNSFIILNKICCSDII